MERFKSTSFLSPEVERKIVVARKYKKKKKDSTVQPTFHHLIVSTNVTPRQLYLTNQE